MSACLAAPSRALRDTVAALFVGTSRPGPPTIGIELELIPYRIADRGVVPIDEMRAALDGLPYVGFEPGGQLELNPPPQPSASKACAELARLVGHVDTRLRGIGVAATAIGVNPWHTVDQLGLQLRSHRYLAMDAHFARIGPAGRAFMRQTAATQICVGLAAGDEGMQQWRTANLVAPVLAALFANAPVPGARTAICRAADPARSRHGNPPMTIEAYANFAAAAQPLDGTFAGDEAVAAHLSTLFPPVRPRGAYLEFRALDALPMPRLRSAAGLLAGLLGHPPTTRAAERVCADADPAELWDIAAGTGCRHPRMRELATRLIVAADEAGRALPSGYL